MTQVTEGQTAPRKDDHIRINLEQNVQFPNLTTGLEHYRFMHEALPEIDIAEVDTSVELSGLKNSFRKYPPEIPPSGVVPRSLPSRKTRTSKVFPDGEQTRASSPVPDSSIE